MTGVHGIDAKPAMRLTNLVYTDPLPHLPLPQVPHPLSASAIDTSAAAENACVADASFLERAAGLLRDADVSYM